MSMNKEQAIQVLLQAVAIGQSKGAYNLKEAQIIANAAEILEVKAPVEEPPAEPAPEKVKAEKVK